MFRRLTAVLVLLACATPALAAAPPADLVLLDADVRTMDIDRPKASALAVRDGRIAEVGETGAIRALVGPQTQVIDAKGRVVLPGFIDAHIHTRPQFDEMGPFGRLDLTPEGGVTSRQALFAKIAAKVAVTPEGQLVSGWGYNDNLVGGHPTAKELDAVSPSHPVMLTHSSGHRSVVNTRALTLAGIDATTKDPEGGQIVRGADGAATGIVLERASGLFSTLWADAPKPSREALLAAYRKEFQNFASEGLTSVGIAGAGPDDLDIYRSLLRTGTPVRIYAMTRDAHLDWLIANRNTPEWQVERLTLNAIKLVHGNSLSGRTAWLYEPYAHDKSYFGMPPKRSQAELNEIVQRVHDAGLQAAIHSNGDREIDMVLTAFEAAQAKAPRLGTRHRIEHASIVNQGILDRIKRDEVALAPHSYILNHGEKMEEYGAARWAWMHPNKRALDMGILVGGTSDHPVSPPNVMQRIQSLVTRRARSNGKIYGDGQQVSVDQALRLWTMGSAGLQFEEKEKGSITSGKLADLVILSADPSKTPPEQIEKILVDATIIGGVVVFDRAQASEKTAER